MPKRGTQSEGKKTPAASTTSTRLRRAGTDESKMKPTNKGEDSHATEYYAHVKPKDKAKWLKMLDKTAVVKKKPAPRRGRKPSPKKKKPAPRKKRSPSRSRSPSPKRKTTRRRYYTGRRSVAQREAAKRRRREGGCGMASSAEAEAEAEEQDRMANRRSPVFQYTMSQRAAGQTRDAGSSLLYGYLQTPIKLVIRNATPNALFMAFYRKRFGFWNRRITRDEEPVTTTKEFNPFYKENGVFMIPSDATANITGPVIHSYESQFAVFSTEVKVVAKQSYDTIEPLRRQSIDLGSNWRQEYTIFSTVANAAGSTDYTLFIRPTNALVEFRPAANAAAS